MTTWISVPTTDVPVALTSRALLNPYGHVTGMTYDNYGPHLTIRLHDGIRLNLQREGDDWILGLAEGKDIRDATVLFGPDGRMTEAARAAINELWHAACSVIDQVTKPIVDAAGDDLARLLDRVLTEPPF